MNVAMYKKQKKGWYEIMSFADLMTLSGQLAAEIAHESAQDAKGTSDEFVMDYWFGRLTCEDSSGDDNVESFPNGHGDFAHIAQYFSDVFDFDERETIAIMGAHTLGIYISMFFHFWDVMCCLWCVVYVVYTGKCHRSASGT